MKKMINSEHIEGYVFDHTLAIKTVQNTKSANFGKEFIAGELNIATDESCLNVIPVHFSYVTPTTKNGSANATYNALKQIIETGTTVVLGGVETATKVKVDTALDLNDFYNNEGNLVSAKRNEGGFVTIVSKLCDETERNKFTVDIVINNVKHVEADTDKNIDEHAVIHGAIFNFRNAILPVDLVIKNEAGISYFENLDATPAEPVFIKVSGRINCSTEVRTVKEENGFGGEDAVTNYERKVREWLVTWCAKEAYDFGDEKILTSEELVKAAQDREVYLADVKKRNDDYKASKEVTKVPATTPLKATPIAAKKGEYTF